VKGSVPFEAVAPRTPCVDAGDVAAGGVEADGVLVAGVVVLGADDDVVGVAVDGVELCVAPWTPLVAGADGVAGVGGVVGVDGVVVGADAAVFVELWIVVTGVEVCDDVLDVVVEPHAEVP
jgi:hypothetical protein